MEKHLKAVEKLFANVTYVRYAVLNKGRFLPFFNSKSQIKTTQINFRSAMWTSVIAGSAFETAGTFDMKLIAKDVVSAFFSSSLILANIARTARRDITKPSQRIGQEVDLCFFSLWKLSLA